MAIKERCIRCMKITRSNGTCQNPKCSRYVPESNDSATKFDSDKK